MPTELAQRATALRQPLRRWQAARLVAVVA
jgi:hypothetical protein